MQRRHGQTHAIGQIKKEKDLWIEALVKSRTDEYYSWTVQHSTAWHLPDLVNYNPVTPQLAILVRMMEF